jgi:uncharacterized damage-inducible protein DinB
MSTELRQLIEYLDWADERTLEGVAQLPEDALRRDLGGSFPSVLTTMVHMLSAEWAWLQRWHGASPGSWPEDWRIDDHAALAARWSEVRRERSAFFGALPEAAFERDFPYRNMKGETFSHPLAEQVRHVVNHASYHRGQVAAMLRRLGVSPPNTDLIRFYRERRGRAS